MPIIPCLIFSLSALHGSEAWSPKASYFRISAIIPRTCRTNAMSLDGEPNHAMKSTQSQSFDPRIQRRAFAAGIIIPAFTVATSAMAKPVGEGGLPDGARQFDNLVRAQRDWIKLGKAVESRHEEFTDEEWKNVGFYLRKLYSVGDDMTFLSQNMEAAKKN
uniref:Uncharacterized protein n=1 Tax=Octactis speculum TaxID=3111310 RepID=A0A7S2H2F4_9STRA